MVLFGIDISHHNATQVKTGILDLSKPDFVIMKATEGETYRDPKMKVYLSHVDPERQGIGFYHYARPDLHYQPDEEVHNFLTCVGDTAGHALYALDVEGAALKLPDVNLAEWVLKWCRMVHGLTGVLPLVYTGTEGLEKIGAAILAKDIGLWYPRYRAKITKKMYAPYPFVALWQFCETPWDCNKFFGTREQWLEYCYRRLL